ncbi:putative Late nodulin [Medicago truncatula]|uniref:Nodule Cysteine-Rich (NCR) secreted peptide n=1 Tax=Medicago truncatula TaxID=3880 RepID=I3SP41_MEDTR|nr:unknown [Medicago truncatula]KEH17206.1 Nodule Cysteine-Rich (NCR) secreted peptide [Medicago truncatula]RHN51797.1 putative Late nodulin [Medicago truncatula]
MAQVIMFVGALIIFLSLFLVETKKTDIPCDSRNDCPQQILPRYVLCVNGLCRIYFP